MISLHYVCSFVPSKEAGQSDAPLRCRIRWDSSRSIVSLNVGYRVNPERWDAKAQRCAVNSFHGRHRVPASTINREIQRFADAVDSVFASFVSRDVWPTVEDVRSAVRVELGIDERRVASVQSALDEFVRDGLGRLSWGAATPEKFRALRHHLEAWEPQLGWDCFTTDGLTRFVVHLRDSEGLRNSTIEKQLGFLRWFLRWSCDRGYLACRDFESFRPRLKSTQKRVIFLEWEELMRVWDFRPAPGREYLERVRDIFCFCAFTSLRYSDAMELRWSDVSKTSIRVTTQKTADSLVIELNRWSDEILGRYVDCGFEGDFVFPRVANQVMNRDLKEICKACGIDSPIRVTWYRGSTRVDEVHPKYELVGTHCARRTFICNALMMGIAPSVVMQWTGHSDYKAMKPYIDIADDAKAKAMALFDGKK